MSAKLTLAPESTAVRVALWRALHVQIDPAPHVLEDEVGLKLAAPDKGWRSRPDMDPQATKIFRASIVARARFIEDFVVENAIQGIRQYVILGAGLDSFAQRRPDIAPKLKIFEVDQPGPQAWKQQRLIELGFGSREWLKFVPVDFEKMGSWLESLVAAGFEIKKPTLLASTGVSMYLTKEATMATLRQAASLAPGTTFVMSFLVPIEFADPSERAGREMSQKGARASGTPFINFYAPDEMLAMARKAGFRQVKNVRGPDLVQRYFAGRTDGLHPGSSEVLLVATV